MLFVSRSIVRSGRTLLSSRARWTRTPGKRLSPNSSGLSWHLHRSMTVFASPIPSSLASVQVRSPVKRQQRQHRPSHRLSSAPRRAQVTSWRHRESLRLDRSSRRRRRCQNSPQRRRCSRISSADGKRPQHSSSSIARLAARPRLSRSAIRSRCTVDYTQRMPGRSETDKRLTHTASCSLVKLASSAVCLSRILELPFSAPRTL